MIERDHRDLSPKEKALTALLRKFIEQLQDESCAPGEVLYVDSWGQVSILCSGARAYEAMHCMLKPGHAGKCYCHVHHVEFEPCADDPTEEEP